MISAWVLISAAISFVVTWAFGRKLIPYLHKLKYGQTILEIGPSWHKDKQGTPTMGGIMFIVGMFVAIVFCLPVSYFLSGKNQETNFMMIKIISGLIMALGYGLVGFLDDYVKIVKKQNLGLTAIQKLILQFLIAFGYLFSVYFASRVYGVINTTSTLIPFLGRVNIGPLYWPIAAILIVGMVNAVNLTDGIDGLNSSVTFFVAIFFMIIAGFFNMLGVSVVSGALIGGCFGFLLWNMHPAKVFMGDTGSLFLGGMICMLAFTIDLPVLLPILGVIYILEMFSVMLQVLYFKLSHGKRLFKMSPIHHHFEMSGWSEFKICLVFSLITIIFGMLASILVFWGV